MEYSQVQIMKIKEIIFRQIDNEINLAKRNNTVDKILQKYNIVLDDTNYESLINKKSKILILGQLSGKIKDYLFIAKKLGIAKENLEFVDYNSAKHFSVERLKYSCVYSDIICGPIPHKIDEMGDTSGLIAEIERNPSMYPKLIKAVSNDSLKFSITKFREYLKKTRYYNEIIFESC